MNRPLNNQRGISLIMVTVIISVVIGALMVATTQYFDTSVKELRRDRDRIAGLQVLQDLAVLAQRANEVYVSQGNTCTGYTQSPSGQPFCWKPLPLTQNCVRNPSGGANICLTLPPPTISTGLISTIATLDAEPPRMNRLEEILDDAKDYYTFRHQLIAQVERDVLHTFDSGTANAAAPAGNPYLPDISVAAPAPLPNPNNQTITAIACPGGSATHCKQCSAATPCLELRVCLRGGGCADFTAAGQTRFDWFRERLVVLPRQ